MSCTCGHEIEDHKDEVGECQVEGCLCCGYEEQEDEEVSDAGNKTNQA